MNLFRDRRIIEQEYLDWVTKNPEVKDCPFTVISFLEGAGYLRDRRAVGKPESNRGFINSLPNRKFAELTINYSEFVDVFTTSDGSEFGDIESAIDHEVWWLDQPHKEEPDG